LTAQLVLAGSQAATAVEGGDHLRQFVVGGGVCICNIAVHAFMMTTIVQVARTAVKRETSHSSLLLIGVMISTVSVLMITHAFEVIIWSLAYWIVDIVPRGANLVYFAFVNYTTLGYGDVTPGERWQLLGPITAMNGVLLFGWSTAVIFEILRRTMAVTASEAGGRIQSPLAPEQS
jgi:hypothetical protein